jgi:hypothetical protein
VSATAPVATANPTPGQESNELIRRYAANPPFRSATADELINHDNPCRRPVRPHDLEHLDYSRPLPASQFLSLSSLLGHRMLLNIYEAETLFLPPDATSIAWRDFEDFYSPDSSLLGELARPALETHLFSFLDERRWANAASSSGELRAACLEVEAWREEGERALATAVEGRQTPRRAAIFLLLQLSCGAPARERALVRGLLGEYETRHARLTDLVAELAATGPRRADRVRALFESAGLSGEPRAYWQFYLTSSLAATNNVYRLARDHSRLFEFVGALTHELIRDRAYRSTQRDTIGRAVDGAELAYFDLGCDQHLDASELYDRLVEPLVERYGVREVGEGFLAGLRGAARLQQLADHDVREQIVWADSLAEYKAKAVRLQETIEQDRLEIDLETFVETSEETSTTHVHDDHRLVVVEDGQMHFWNNVGEDIALSTGDKVLIPKSRLHGSVVLSGQCTYHQPVITDGLLATVE